MHTEVFNNIDTLIEMAGISTNVEDKNAELITLRREIRHKKVELKDIKSIMTDARYFDASNELLDKNIEISLKSKISRLHRRLKEIEQKIAEITTGENKLHEEIKALKKKLTKNEKYVNTLKEKKEKSITNEYYANLLKEEESNVAALTKRLDEKTKEHENLLKELDLNNQASKEIITKLEGEEARLNDILDNLKNPNAYINEELKASDEGKVTELSTELEALEKRELELATDASIIGMEAKELIAASKTEEALAKIKELVTIAKSVPYMDINNTAILDDELDKREKLRIEISNLIESKNYESTNSEAIKERISYVTSEIEKNNEEIANLENRSNEIDEFINSVLGVKITSLENEINTNEDKLKEYKEILKEKKARTRSKTNLEQAISKKEKENVVLDNMLQAYKEDLLNKIAETNELIGKGLKLKEINTRYESELEGLQKLSLINFQTKDIIDEEKDRDKLKKLNEEIAQIKNRQKYDKTPNEIYDLIEMSLANTIKEPPKEKTKEVEIDSLFSTESNLELNGKNRLKVIEMIPVETVKKAGGGTK